MIYYIIYALGAAYVGYKARQGYLLSGQEIDWSGVAIAAMAWWLILAWVAYEKLRRVG